MGTAMKKILFELEHGLYSIAIVLACYFLHINMLIGVVAICAFFTGREHAQAEYRWIEEFGSHRRAYLPWWGWADRRVWNVHSLWWNLIFAYLCAGSTYLILKEYV